MDTRELRSRRRRYARWSGRRRFYRWLPFPRAITLPTGRRLERYAYLFWRVRLPLYAVPAAAGWLVLSWPGIGVGLAVGVLAELALSYRTPRGSPARPVPTSGPPQGPGGPAGVREPRRPHPSGDAGAAELPSDAPSAGIG